MHSKNKIIYIVATQYDNMGDLLINKCLVDELSNYGELYLDAKKVPESFLRVLLDTTNSTTLSTVSKISLKGLGALVAPLLFKKGFTHLFKSPGPFGGVSNLKAATPYFVFFYIFKLMRLRACKSYILGADLIVESKYDITIQKLFAGVLAGTYVRSKKNVELLNSINIDNVGYIPDLCFLMHEKVKVVDKKDTVGISFRDLGNEVLNDRIMKSCDAFISVYLNSGFKVVIYYQVDRDCGFNKSIYEAYKHLDNVVFREKCLEYEEISFYEPMFSVLSNRLHVLLLGQVHEALPIGVLNEDAKTSKIHNIYRSIGLENFIFESVSVDDIKETFDNSTALREAIRNANIVQYNILKSAFKSIFKVD